MIVLWVVIGLVVVVVLWVVATYNGLVRLRNQFKNAWAQIDVQLKRRHDLIPNLVETAKGYMTHERETLEAVTKARNLAAQASGAGEASQAEQGLTGALGQFFLIVERYPDLKANQNFLSLQEELASTENKIGFARQFYNDQVMKHNIRIQSFPATVVAGTFHFTQAELFELEDEAEREVPEVKF
ncbi:MAG: LemA family protein [Candidatus Brocadiae bacterium]|nr:LemA family protein [Candidatus Brocadiia bacterium]